MIRSGARAIAVAATLGVGGCNSDQIARPAPSIAAIVAQMDSLVIVEQARGDTQQADFLTALEIPLVFGVPWSFVEVALDTFEVQRTYEVNHTLWIGDAYAVVDTVTADTLLVFTAASNYVGDAMLRSDREGSATAGVLIAGDTVDFAPEPSAIHIATASAAGATCPTPRPTRNPAITSLRSAKCALITINASDTLTTTFPLPGYLAGIWFTSSALGVEFLR